MTATMSALKCQMMQTDNGQAQNQFHTVTNFPEFLSLFTFCFLRSNHNFHLNCYFSNTFLGPLLETVSCSLYWDANSRRSCAKFQFKATAPLSRFVWLPCLWWLTLKATDFFPQRGMKFSFTSSSKPANRDMATTLHCMCEWLQCWYCSYTTLNGPLRAKSSPVLRYYYTTRNTHWGVDSDDDADEFRRTQYTLHFSIPLCSVVPSHPSH